jgi:hypothetical protein
MAVEQIEVDPAKVDELMGRLIQDFAGAGPLTPAEVAERSGTAEPYVAEWLKAQAAGGYLDYHPDGGRFSLPPEGAAVLADEHGTKLVGGFAQMLLAMSRDWVLVEEGFRSDRGSLRGGRAGGQRVPARRRRLDRRPRRVAGPPGRRQGTA